MKLDANELNGVAETAANAAAGIPRAKVDWEVVKRLNYCDPLKIEESKALYTSIHHLENEVTSLREALAAFSAPLHEPDVYETRFTRECCWTESPKDEALRRASMGSSLRKLFRRAPTQTLSGRWTPLMQFYGVDTPELMVEAMQKQITRLQGNLPMYRDPYPRTPREG
jgi:hypothetical protein